MAQHNVICPNCAAEYSVDEAHFGKAALCNKCNQRFVLELPDGASTQSPAAVLGKLWQGNSETTDLVAPRASDSQTEQWTSVHEVGRSTPVLQVVEGIEPGRVFGLNRDETRIGRGRECQIVVDDDCVSRIHARVVRLGDVYFLEDLGSKNGTFLHGELVKTRVRLANEDRIRISATLFAFRSGGPVVRELKDDSSSLLCSIDATGDTDTMAQAHPERKLRAILRITRSLGTTLDLEAMLSKMLDGLFDIFPQADRGLVLLSDHGRLNPKAVKHRALKHGSIQYSRTIVEKAMGERQAILSEDILRDERIPMTASVAQLEICSIMCVPLLAQDSRPLGILQLETQDRARKFDADDMEMLTSVATQASISVEYAQLHTDAVKHAQIQKELDLARVVQHSFLPKSFPELSGYSFWAYYEAAGQVGGDFYDFLRLPNGNQAVLIGDVAGKGVPAALMMAKISALCKVALLSHPDNVADAVNVLNREVCDAGLEFGLVTLVLGVIDPARHEVTIADAGHMSPMFRRADGTIDEEVGNAVRSFPLGFDRQLCYTTGRCPLAPGEFVVLFSDGISEAMNSNRQLYSAERIRRRLAPMKDATAAEVGQALLDDVRRHVAAREQNDDMTLVVFRRDPS